jgi:hypothetical protein
MQEIFFGIKDSKSNALSSPSFASLIKINLYSYQQPDLNNNNLLMTNGFGGCWPEDTSTLFEELPSLPELDDRYLDEFFRQVEQRGGEGPMGTEEMERIIAAKKADEEEEELKRDGKKQKETKGPEGILQ